MSTTRAPTDFLWGTATAAYQIEGAVSEDGRGPSVWDTFCHTPGAVERSETGDVACDHYHRWRDDVALMGDLGARAYRFSMSWPRVMPSGRGTVNAAGLDFYDRLVDGLLERDIVPFITLYHWDLPQTLQDAGGWLNRDTARALADYAAVVTRRLGDRVRHWVTLNEPFINVYNGYVEGSHAPGLKGYEHYFPVAHHLLLGHGLALQAIRSEVRETRAGVAFSLAAVEPVDDHALNVEVVPLADAFTNRICLDPVLRGEYPVELRAMMPLDLVHGGDLATIGAPTDFIGVNYYIRQLVRATPLSPMPGFEVVPPATDDLTDMGWEQYPQGLAYWLRRAHEDYPGHDLYVTESGAAFPDAPGPGGVVSDPRRIAYLRDHIGVALDALAGGVPLKGYFIWSLLDNFEWVRGFFPRFGLIYTDFATQRRTIKESGHWYSRLIATGETE